MNTKILTDLDESCQMVFSQLESVVMEKILPVVQATLVKLNFLNDLFASRQNADDPIQSFDVRSSEHIRPVLDLVEFLYLGLQKLVDWLSTNKHYLRNFFVFLNQQALQLYKSDPMQSQQEGNNQMNLTSHLAKLSFNETDLLEFLSLGDDFILMKKMTKLFDLGKTSIITHLKEITDLTKLLRAENQRLSSLNAPLSPERLGKLSPVKRRISKFEVKHVELDIPLKATIDEAIKQFSVIKKQMRSAISPFVRFNFNLKFDNDRD